MRAIQVTFDGELVNEGDKIVKTLRTTRSAFTRNALRKAINQLKAKSLEEKHRKWRRNQHAEKDEFSIRENEQEWEINEKRRD